MWDWASFLHYIHSPYLLTGAAISLGLSVGAMLIGLVLGLIAAMMRMSERRWLRLPASGYVWLFRGTPVLVQLIIIYTGLPQLGIQLGVVASALIGLGLNEGAYLAEIIRSGVLAVPKGQFEAARAIGMTWPKTMRVVVMPQALRIMIPPLTNNFITLIQDTSFFLVLGVAELAFDSQTAAQASSSPLIRWTLYAVELAIYFAICYPLALISRRTERRLARGAAGAQ